MIIIKNSSLSAYTKIRSFSKFSTVFTKQDVVYVTEYVIGSLARFGIVGGKFFVGDEQNWYSKFGNRTFWKLAEQYGLQEALTENFKDNATAFCVVYGRYGKQSVKYGQRKAKLVLVDLFADNKYLEGWVLSRFAVNYKVPLAPILYRGNFSPQVLQLTNGTSNLDLYGNTPKAGIVIRSIVEQSYPGLGRKILKYSKTQ